MPRDHAPPSYWRQDKMFQHTLIHEGKQAAMVNLIDYTAAIGPDRHDLTQVHIPRSREIFSEVEKRLRIPAVQEYRPLDRTTTEHPRRDSERQAAQFTRTVRKSAEPGHYINIAWQRLAERESKQGLTLYAKAALPQLRDTLTQIADQGGKWNPEATKSFKNGLANLGKIPPGADRLEQLARNECERAQACLHQARSINAPAQKRDPGRDRDKGKDKDKGRER